MTLRSILFAVVASSCLVGSGCSRAEPDIRLTTDPSGRLLSISFVGKDVTDADLKQIANQDSLREVSLQECSQITERGFSAIQEIAAGLTKVELVRVPISDGSLAHFASSQSLKELTLANTNVVGSGLRHLANTPLVRLVIHSRVVTSEGLAALSEVATLEDLELHCPEISLRDLPCLGKLKKLQSLIAFRTPVGTNGLEVLRGLAQLRKLVLSSADITDESVEVLNTMTDLAEIEVASASITDVGLKELNLPRLKELSLDNCRGVTDQGLGNLCGMPLVESLMLGGTSVTGVDLTPLATLRNLKSVLMKADQFKGDDKSIKALKELLPDCEVILMRG